MPVNRMPLVAANGPGAPETRGFFLGGEIASADGAVDNPGMGEQELIRKTVGRRPAGLSVLIAFES